MAEKEIPGYNGLYLADENGNILSAGRISESSNGKVRILKRKILKPVKKENGYYIVTLHKDGKQSSRYVHRLIAETFLPNPNGLPQVNHKNENPADNRLINLEWCDGKYNTNYGTAMQRAAAKNSKKVMYTRIYGEKVGQFNSITEAAKFFKVSIKAISAALHKGSPYTCKGYYWQFI